MAAIVTESTIARVHHARTKIRRRAALKTFDQAAALEAFERRHRRFGREQQVRAVLHVRTRRVQALHEPVRVEPARAMDRERYGDGGRDDEHRQGHADALPSPSDDCDGKGPRQRARDGVKRDARAGVLQGLA
ncbi:hypothetical protein ABIE51_003587 [Lysobacter sp. OAE881]|uniref:hypothetical protein n=1 Tax=Lysobacter sp. OAE881 TaxID=2663813 RepID=UPI003396B157